MTLGGAEELVKLRCERISGFVSESSRFAQQISSDSGEEERKLKPDSNCGEKVDLHHHLEGKRGRERNDR